MVQNSENSLILSKFQTRLDFAEGKISLNAKLMVLTDMQLKHRLNFPLNFTE